MTYIVHKPIITEKSLKEAQNGIYTFAVEKVASKPEIQKAIEDLFKVHVVKITTVLSKGKKRLVGKRRTPVKESGIKKARVTVKKDEKIDLFEVGGEK